MEFNDLEQNLDILQEEAAEIIKVASKIKRFGISEVKFEELAEEIGDLMCLVEIIVDTNPEFISHKEISKAKQKKYEKLERWYRE